MHTQNKCHHILQCSVGISWSVCGFKCLFQYDELYEHYRQKVDCSEIRFLVSFLYCHVFPETEPVDACLYMWVSEYNPKGFNKSKQQNEKTREL